MRLDRPLLLILLALFSVQALSAEPLVHVVQKGETIYGIAKNYSVSYQAVLQANGITDARKVLPGMKLLIPVSHTVAKGETLYGIARTFGVSVEELMRVNKLAPGAVIKPGDTLMVPGSSITVPASPPVASGDTATSGASSDSSVKLPAKPAPYGAWPAQGEASYLDGKLFGIGIRTQENARIRTVRAGTVISAGPFRGYGRVAFIQAKDGLVYVYGGAQTLGVKIGEYVRAGSEIGKVGIDLKEGTPIAYFLVFQKGNPLDPATVPRE